MSSEKKISPIFTKCVQKKTFAVETTDRPRNYINRTFFFQIQNALKIQRNVTHIIPHLRTLMLSPYCLFMVYTHPTVILINRLDRLQTRSSILFNVFFLYYQRNAVNMSQNKNFNFQCCDKCISFNEVTETTSVSVCSVQCFDHE